MYTFTTQQPTMRKLVQSLSRYEVLASSIYTAVKLGLPQLLPADASISIEKLHESLLIEQKISNKDIGPLTRLLKFLSCYGIFHAEGKLIRHTPLSQTLLQPNISQYFSGIDDNEWRKQGDFLDYLAGLPANSSLFLGLNTPIITLNARTPSLSIASTTAVDLMHELANIQLLSRAIYTAARLALMDLIKNNINTVTELARTLQVNPTALSKLIAILAKYQLLNITIDKQITLTPAGMTLIEGPHETSIKAAAGMANNHWWNSIGNLRHCIETGKAPYIAANNISVFDYLESNVDERQRFDRGLANSDADQDDAVANANFAITSGMSVVDIGGGNGGLITGLLKKNPQIKEAILFDQPKTIEHLRAKAASVCIDASDEHAVLLSQCVLQPGNFLVSDENGIPRGKDLYIIKGVLHDFTDEDVITILKNIANAMSTNSTLKIVERYLIDDNQPHFNKIGDMQMMAFFAAKERSLEDYQRLALKAGLTLDVSSSQPCGNYTIIGAKRHMQNANEPCKFGEARAIMLAAPADARDTVTNSNTAGLLSPSVQM